MMMLAFPIIEIFFIQKFIGQLDVNQFVGAGALTGLFVAMGTVFTMLIRQNNQLRKERDQEITSLKKDVRNANRRIDRLVAIVRQGGLSIPPEVWADDL